jgi:hypothetical protein
MHSSVKKLENAKRPAIEEAVVVSLRKLKSEMKFFGSEIHFGK